MPTWIGDLLSKYGLTNIAGTVTAVLAGLVYVMDTYLGCNIASTVAATIDTTATCKLPSWFPVSWAPVAMVSAASVALLAKLMRPGTWLRNLFGGTAVIVPASSPASGPGTVTPADVAKK